MPQKITTDRITFFAIFLYFVMGKLTIFMRTIDTLQSCRVTRLIKPNLLQERLIIPNHANVILILKIIIQ